MEEKDIEKSFHCVFAMLCIVVGKKWNEKHFERDEEKSGIVWRKNNVNVIYGYSLFLSVWNVKRIGSVIM